MIGPTGPAAQKRRRPRGFAPWKPDAESLELVDRVRDVLDLFRAHLPVTIRQVFYRLVATIGFPKDESSYARLCETLNRARRSGLVAWDSFRDDGFTRKAAPSWESSADWADDIVASAVGFRLDRQLGQSRRLVVWCEAGGMVPQLYRVAREYSVPVFSSGGFDSVTAKHDVAQELAGMGETTVLHVGDLDPSGVHMFGSLDEDVRAFLAGMDADCRVEFVRLAVTREQVDRLDLETSPPKKSDKRSFDGDTVQCEAIPPDELARILRRAILERIDTATLDSVLADEHDQRERLRERATEFRETLR